MAGTPKSTGHSDGKENAPEPSYKDLLGKLSKSQKKFVELFSGDITGSAKLAGISDSYAYTIHRRKKIQDAIKARDREREAAAEAARPIESKVKDLQKFWVDVIENDEISYKDRIRASELLAKSQGLFSSSSDSKNPGAGKGNGAGSGKAIDNLTREEKIALVRELIEEIDSRGGFRVMNFSGLSRYLEDIEGEALATPSGSTEGNDGEDNTNLNEAGSGFFQGGARQGDEGRWRH